MTEKVKDTLAAIGAMMLFFGLGSGFFRLIAFKTPGDLGYADFIGDIWVCSALVIAGLLCVAPYFLLDGQRH